MVRDVFVRSMRDLLEGSGIDLLQLAQALGPVDGIDGLEARTGKIRSWIDGGAIPDPAEMQVVMDFLYQERSDFKGSDGGFGLFWNMVAPPDLQDVLPEIRAVVQAQGPRPQVPWQWIYLRPSLLPLFARLCRTSPMHLEQLEQALEELFEKRPRMDEPVA